MNKILFALSILVAFFISPLAAQPEIIFEETKHNFGEITEGTIATHDFTFTNTGNAPLIISSVNASCGCTTPNWTKEPVMPGKTGVVTASYNSQNRPGAFTKTITVTTNATAAKTTLYITGSAVRGNVVAKPPTKEELETSPRIDLLKEKYALGKIQTGQAVSFSLSIHNSGKSELKISGIKSSCNCTFLDASASKTIAAGSSAEIKIIYKPYISGNKTEEVKIVTNDLTKREAVVVLQAEIVEDIKNQSIIKKEGNNLTF